MCQHAVSTYLYAHFIQLLTFVCVSEESHVQLTPGMKQLHLASLLRKWKLQFGSSEYRHYTPEFEIQFK